MFILKSSQRSYLRSKSHSLKPTVLIGKNKITKGVILSINKAFNANELIKIKFCDYKDQKENLTNKIILNTNSQLIGTIGHIIILYRQNINPENQKYIIIDK